MMTIGPYFWKGQAKEHATLNTGVSDPPAGLPLFYKNHSLVPSGLPGTYSCTCLEISIYE